MPKSTPSLNPARIALFLQSGDPERLQNAATVIASAAALNWEIVLIFLGEALRRHVEDRLDPPSEKEDDPGRPSALIRSARDFGRMTVVACSADARRSGLKEKLIRSRVDEILGMSTILRRIRDAGTKLWI